MSGTEAMQATTDFMLLRCLLDASHLASARHAFTTLCEQGGMAVDRMAWQQASQQAYFYARLPVRSQVQAAAAVAFASKFAALCVGTRESRVSRLEEVFDLAGHTSGQTPMAHYVVETDPEAGWMPEIVRWYDKEHMPGLASVPGCIHARRLLNHDAGPVSFASYDLMSSEVLGSPPWLAVRFTAWSDVVRPHFTNTRRTMFQAL
jgi:hypothetical protein